MQTIEETLFANRKTKENNAPSNYPNTPLTSLPTATWFDKQSIPLVLSRHTNEMLAVYTMLLW
jgi:hypothetical protein